MLRRLFISYTITPAQQHAGIPGREHVWSMRVKAITARASRGMILDVVVFVVNVALMNLLTGRFFALVRLANGGDAFARLALFLFALGMLVLPAAGAVLKRWHFHRRGGRGGEDAHFSGCLPIFNFVLSLMLSFGVMYYLQKLLFGKDSEGNGAGALLFFFGAIVLSVTQTVLVYRYFSPPRKAPSVAFLRDPRSELLGDLCIFVNMILFQVIWNIFSRIPFNRTADIEEVAGRLFWLVFVAMLIYFPPRIFYLAEDFKRPAAWLTMLLANSPTLLRILFGVDTNVRG